MDWCKLYLTRWYRALRGKTPEEGMQWVYSFLDAVADGKRGVNREADRILEERERWMESKRASGRKGGLARVANAATPHPQNHPADTPGNTPGEGSSNSSSNCLTNCLTNSPSNSSSRGDKRREEEIRLELGGGGEARAGARARAREGGKNAPEGENAPAPAAPTPEPPPAPPAERLVPDPADTARRLGYSVYAPVAGSIAMMLPKEISPARLYSAAALKELTPEELEGFVAHYSGRGWEFPTRREDKPRPITDKNLMSAISSWALKKDNYTPGGTRGTGNPNRNPRRVFDPARPIQTQRGDLDYDPGF